MKLTNRTISITAYMVLVVLSGVSSIAHADYGVEIIAQQWEPTKPNPDAMKTVSINRKIITDKVEQALEANEGEICNSLGAELSKVGEIGPGMTIRGNLIKCALGSTGKVFATTQQQNKTISLAVDVPGNSVEITTTAPLVSRADDPVWRILVNAQLLLTAEWSENGVINIRRVAVKVTNIDRPVPLNVTAEFLAFLDSLTAYSQSNTFVNSFTNAMVSNDVLLNKIRSGFASLSLLPNVPTGLNATYKLVDVQPESDRLKFGFGLTVREDSFSAGVVGGAVRIPSQLNFAAFGQCTGLGTIKLSAQIWPREFHGFNVPMGAPYIREYVTTFDLAPKNLANGVKECTYKYTTLPAALIYVEPEFRPTALTDPAFQSTHGGFMAAQLVATGSTSPVQIGTMNVDFDVQGKNVQGVGSIPQEVPSKVKPGNQVPRLGGNPAPVPPHGPTDKIFKTPAPHIAAPAAAKPALPVNKAEKTVKAPVAPAMAHPAAAPVAKQPEAKPKEKIMLKSKAIHDLPIQEQIAPVQQAK